MSQKENRKMCEWDMLKECEKDRKIAVCGHVRPDGDCVGACMALWMYLKKRLPKAQIDVYMEKPAPVYGCLKGTESVLPPAEEAERFDTLFVLDCVRDRMGEYEGLSGQADKIFNIDHHISNEHGCGTFNYVDEKASSTSELVYRLMDKEFVDEEIAKAVYLGIIHDTGALRYSNTSPETLRTAAELIGYGFDFPKLIDETFYEKTYIQNQILGRALLESILFMDGRCIVSVIDKKTMDFYNVTPADLSGIVNQLNMTKGVDCAIFLYQTGLMEYKVSMRSNGKLDVAEVAVMFGGGGHVRAAGCTMNGTVHDVINNLSDRIEGQLKR